VQVAVWDTYVTRHDGRIMHFDIIVPDEMKDASTIHNYGRVYLQSKGEQHAKLSTGECRFCHVQNPRPEWQTAILQDGYYIYEMENCD